MKQIRIILYFALGLTALLLWNAWQKEHALQQSAQTATAKTQTVKQQAQVPTTLPNGQKVQSHISNASAQQANLSNTKDLIHVKTGVLNIFINPNGGAFVQASLPHYPVSQKNPNQAIQLLNTNASTQYTAQSGITNIPGLKDKPIPFRSAKTNYTLADGQKSLVVSLNWRSPTGLDITKNLTFTRGSYAIGVNYKVKNSSASAFDGRFYMQTKRTSERPKSGDHLIGFHTFFGVAISSPDHPYQKMSFDDLGEEPINKTITGGWLAFIQHYFLTAWVPNAKQPFYYYSREGTDGLYTVGLMGPKLNLARGQETTFGSQFYVGPEIASNLDKLSPKLSLTIDYGWLWFISVIIFWLMKHIYDFIGNWGWSIVLVTLLIKILFYKLSETSYRSMAKMRALSPKLKALKERYSDRQELSKATMQLYKKEKVNPLGGCLPILVQIPVFIALYWVLIESVELRHAPFILWIHDLSAPDPYYILPIIMGGTMFLQQKLSPAPPDPTQAKIMMFLPVFFTFLFLKFPSGLVLYWVVNNALSILQQWYITKRFESGAYKQKDKKKKKK